MPDRSFKDQNQEKEDAVQVDEPEHLFKKVESFVEYNRLYIEPKEIHRTEEDRIQAAEQRVKSGSGNNYEKVTQKYMRSIESLGVAELKVMQENEDYRRDCVMTQPTLIGFGNKCETIEQDAANQCQENIKLYREYEELRERYVKDVNVKFSEKADLAKDMLSQIEDQM